MGAWLRVSTWLHGPEPELQRGIWSFGGSRRGLGAGCHLKSVLSMNEWISVRRVALWFGWHAHTSVFNLHASGRQSDAIHQGLLVGCSMFVSPSSACRVCQIGSPSTKAL